MGFSPDRPIEAAKEDLLERSSFAARLATSIRAWNYKDSLVIALQGAWGTGKTSVKNMVLENLRSSTKEGPQIIEFSPWQVSGTGALVNTFFHELGIALGAVSKQDAKLSNKLTSYAKGLALLGDVAKPIGSVVSLFKPEVGTAITVGGIGLQQSAQVAKAGAEAAAAKNAADSKSLTDLKRELGESLASLSRPILVVIDDVDRLTVDEILQVFQLVKVNADFPNLVYLLLYEREIVEKALDQISGGRGHEFLQKIVQVELHIPHAHRKSIEKVLFAGLDRLLGAAEIHILFDQNRWSNLYVDGVSRYFQNLRHVYRFLGSLAFHVAQFKSKRSFEVNPIDLIGLEALRVFEPGLYESLPSAKRILTRDHGKDLFGHIKQSEVESAIEQLLLHVPTERRAAVRGIIGVLFPPTSGAFDSDRGVISYKQEWLRERRVCHADLFDKFFALVVSEGDLSQAELDRIISLTSDRQGFVSECQALLRRGMLEIAFERLDAYKEEILLENMPALICALCDLRDAAPEKEIGLFTHDIGVYMGRLVYFGLRREKDLDRRSAILKEAFQDSAGVLLPVELVRLNERVGDRTEETHEFLVSESSLEELKAVCVDKIRARAASNEFPQLPELSKCLFAWFKWGDKQEVRTWISEHVRDRDGAIWLLRTFLIKSSSTGSYGTKVHHHIDLRVIEQFANIAHIKDLTAQSNADAFQGLNRIALVEFRKAIKRRSKGIPDDDWHWRVSGADPEEE